MQIIFLSWIGFNLGGLVQSAMNTNTQLRHYVHNILSLLYLILYNYNTKNQHIFLTGKVIFKSVIGGAMKPLK